METSGRIFTIKCVIHIFLLILFASPLGAQEKVDSTYEFRFVPQKDIFFIPFSRNQAELDRLSNFVEKYHELIVAKKLPLYIDGYCSSQPEKIENLAIARQRSNQVKSQLILHNGLTEDCFITRNYAKKGNRVIVTVRTPISTPIVSPKESAPNEQPINTEQVSHDRQEIINNEQKSNVAEEKTEAVSVPTKNAPPLSRSENVSGAHSSALSLRANLLRWATLTPDVGIEWRSNCNWSILINGSWTAWSWKHNERNYALWKIAPEARYYMGKKKKGFLGIMYHLGDFNYKFEDIGKQGSFQGGGITGGYALPLNRSLSLDFHAGVGYTRADYDKYEIVDNVNVKQGKDSQNYWGVNQVGVTLVWKLF